MCSHVRGQIAGNGKSFLTHLAAIRRFSRVPSHVPRQVARLRASFTTLFTTIRLFLCVWSHVLGKVTVLVKSFFTLLATTRRFSSMCSKVHGSIVQPLKIFVYTSGNGMFFPQRVFQRLWPCGKQRKMSFRSAGKVLLFSVFIQSFVFCVKKNRQEYRVTPS